MESEKSFVEGLADILVEDGVVSRAEADDLIKDFGGRSKVSFDYFLLSEGLIQKDDLLVALSKYYQVPAVDVRGYFFDAGLVQNFPEDFLLHYGLIPLEVDQNMMTVVAHKPDMEGLEGKIQEFCDYNIEFRVGLLRDIVDVVREYYGEEVVTTGNSDDEQEVKEEIEEVDIGQLPDESI